MNIISNPHKTLVFDIGSCYTRFGYAGDVQPSFSVPSSIIQRVRDGEKTYEFGDSWLSKNMPDLEVVSMIDGSGNLVPDHSQIIPTYLDWTYSKCLQIDPSDHPVLLTQPTQITINKGQFENWRKSWCEHLFEFANHPYLCLEFDSSLAALSRGLQTGIVLDFGWLYTRIVPIFEGKPLLNVARNYQIGTYTFVDYVETLTNQSGGKIYTLFDPPEQNQQFNVNFKPLVARFPLYTPTESQQKYAKRNIIIDILKTQLTYISTKQQDPMALLYYVPGHEPLKTSVLAPLKSIFWQRIGNSPIPLLPDTIADVIGKCPGDVQRLMWKNIIPVGGLSNVPGMYDKLRELLGRLVPRNYMVDIIPPMHPMCNGSFSVWVGGSIMGSLDNFPEFCISKQEWSEQGEAILSKKCK
ncbi:Actin family protein [Trichomonas vaginalis G3]|uniref:Actin family protein n=1 Tax=Trichomonas vaginalis (strain ATCC PRA-98 / G3) TaxID=412133 RepID=A2E0F7_TRIV3|nr:ATP binding [Trichomonas vaginalis G3]EAY13837.1 Actin family protein [Trichomonas vaginalis G3]KAI5519842.1 ATP binding [Trichomonas vaginalis G3]|eukprot:XP_001326060.1 Actin family protein [Trichomonas vaginalis G3]